MEIVGTVFGRAEGQRWDGSFYQLDTREDVRRMCHQHSIPPERAEQVALPLRPTKRGVLIRATKG